MKIEIEELTAQIKIALQDVFNAQVSQMGQVITLTFDNGQEFLLQVIEK